eukprot:473075-Prymnesium_polylepis.1
MVADSNEGRRHSARSQAGGAWHETASRQADGPDDAQGASNVGGDAQVRSHLRQQFGNFGGNGGLRCQAARPQPFHPARPRARCELRAPGSSGGSRKLCDQRARAAPTSLGNTPR